MTNTEQPSVYFARVGDYIKIGFSRQIRWRLYDICRPHGDYRVPDALPPGVRPTLLGTIPGGFAVEHDIHADLWEWREVGEWFAATDVVLAYIDKRMGTEVRR